MLKKVVLFLVFVPHILSAEFLYTINNSNFIISQSSSVPNTNKSYTYNYDRLRLRGDYKQEGLFFTAIGDGVNYLGYDYVNSQTYEYVKAQNSDTPFNAQTKFHDYYEGSYYAKLYRLYGGYEDDKNRVVAGLQNISMGVGRIWTPTNLFNPKNSYALEPDETFGVAALSFTRYLNSTSHITVVVSQKKDNTFKYAARYKTFLDFADFAFDAISSDDTNMLGYEIEGNLYDTGVELRSEGVYIKSNLNISSATKKEKEFYQAILGAEYGFVNGLNVAVESYYSSKKFSYQESLLNTDSEVLPNMVYSNFYTGLTASYNINIFLDASLLYVESFNDTNSRFISPALTYTLNNYNSFSIGAMILDGDNNSEFGRFGDTYYFKYVLSF